MISILQINIRTNIIQFCWLNVIIVLLYNSTELFKKKILLCKINRNRLKWSNLKFRTYDLIWYKERILRRMV